MKILQPETLTYKVELTQVEIDVITFALGQCSPADHIKAMPHYTRELEGFDGRSSKLYDEFTQYVSQDTRKALPHLS